MQIQKTELGWHITLPQWRMVEWLVTKLACRVNTIPDGGESVPHTHNKLSSYMVLKAGLKIGDHILQPKNIHAFTLHFIYKNMEHPWVSLDAGAQVLDMEPHQVHAFTTS